MEKYDVVVIGAGVMGRSAAWHLARRGRSVVVLEQFGPSHNWGSSGGTSRVFRLENPASDYVSLAHAALQGWKTLERESGRNLLDVVGGVIHGSTDLLADRTASLEVCGLTYELLSSTEASRRWPGMLFEEQVLFQPDAARIDVQGTMESLLEGARAYGADFRFNQKVENLSVNADSVAVATTEKSFHAGTVVAACGPWMTDMVGDFVRLPQLTVTQEQPAYFAAANQDQQWPIFIHPRSSTEIFSGFYGLFTPGKGMKVGAHAAGHVVDPTSLERTVDPKASRVLADYVTKWIPGVDPTPIDPEPCLYTSTLSNDFVLDRRGPLVVASPCSGSGFKFVPEIGRIIADLATGGEQGNPRFRLPVN